MNQSLKTIFLTPETSNDEGNIIRMSSQLFRELQLKKDIELPILLGKKSINAFVQIFEGADPNEIIVPEKLMKQFSLPISPYKFQVCLKTDDYTLLIGPIVGLVTDIYINEKNEPHFRSVHMFCEELHQGIAEAGGFFFVFSYDEFENQGYYRQNDQWIPSILPLPDVIYNRVHSRKMEYAYPYKKFRQRLTQLNIPFFNDRFLSKWEVYEHLSKEYHLLPFLPDTKLFGADSLNDFAEKYETIFIKPIHGSLGRNIIKITKTDSDFFLVETSLQANSNESFSKDGIIQLLKPILGNRIYIIQQGISLVKFNGCITDFRVLCHKTSRHDWEVTSIVARISGEEEIVSNLARGGKVMKPLAALSAIVQRQQASEILTLMKKLAISIAAVISESFPGTTGELGIDIGVDLDGKPWLIEVNSKPSKSFEDGQVKIRPSAKAIIAFCRLLTFADNDEKEEKA